MIYVREDEQPNYQHRTKINAENAALTVDFSIDNTTAGSLCTKKVAGHRFLRIDMTKPIVDAVFSLKYGLDVFHIAEDSVLNIAGNGIYTFTKHGWSQHNVNKYVLETLRSALFQRKIRGLRSGGQTGADIAGAVAARVLGLDAVITLPQGYRQRMANGTDERHTRTDIENQIEFCAREFMDLPRVWNKNDRSVPDNAIYCGRPGEWGNPFIIGKDGDRNEVIEKFRRHVEASPNLIKRIKTELCGKHLVCHCKPQSCHADILHRIANRPYL